MNLKHKTANVFDYSNYLRNYYNRLASGKEKVPSDAELTLFLRQLGNVSLIKSAQSEVSEEAESIDEVAFKMTA